jgi:acyl-CoA-binding protein
LYVNLCSVAWECVDLKNKYGHKSPEYIQAGKERDRVRQEFIAYIENLKKKLKLEE